MIASVPSIAFGSPPLTGASRKSTPFASSAAPTFCDTIGLIELMSMTVEPFFTPSSTPFGPEHRLLHFRSVGHHRDDDVGLAGDVLRRRPFLRARGSHVVHAGGHDVVHRHRVTGLQQILHHGLAHDSETDEPDFAGHDQLLLIFRKKRAPILTPRRSCSPISRA